MHESVEDGVQRGSESGQKCENSNRYDRHIQRELFRRQTLIPKTLGVYDGRKNKANSDATHRTDQSHKVV